MNNHSLFGRGSALGLQPVQLAVLAVVVPLGWLSRTPSEDPAELDALAARFRFTRLAVPPPAAPPGGVRFAVNPSTPQLQVYLHSIGSGIALGDVDGDGLANDLCATDVRTKALVIEPAPGTPPRYAPFELPFELPDGREESWPGTCRFADLNEDGRMDVIVSAMSAAPEAFLRRAGDPSEPPGPGAFRRVPLLAGGPQRLYVPAIEVIDVDGDGHLDVVLGAYLRDGVAYYDGDATTPVVLQDGFARARNGGTNRVLLWQSATTGPEPTVSFREIAGAFPGDTANAWTLALAAGDFDDDGLADLYVANDFGPDTLLVNRSTPGDVRLVEVRGQGGALTPTSDVVGRDSFKGMGADVADVNGDGRLDLFVSNIGSDHGLHEGHFLWQSTGGPWRDDGPAPLVDRAEALGVSHSGWSWDCRMDDFDNDGVLEIVQATGFFKGTVDRWPNIAQIALSNDNLVKHPEIWPMFPPQTDIDGWVPEPFWVRTSTGRYADLATRLFPGVTVNARAIATADVDGDGDLDLAFGDQWEDALFFRNDAPRPGRSLGLHLLLPLGTDGTDGTDGSDGDGVASHPGHPTSGEGTPAVGARATVHLADGRALMREVDLSNGHTGARAPDLLFGLGDAVVPVAVDLRWRGRDGVVRRASTTLTPGWHTVVLGTVDGGAR